MVNKDNLNYSQININFKYEIIIICAKKKTS